MANTENIEAKLCAYVDGVLDADGRAEIERHLVANPSHRRLLEELVRGREMLRALPPEDAPEDMIDELQGQLERSVLLSEPVDEEAAAVAGRINRWPHRLAAAAIVLLTVGLGVVIFYVLPRAQDSEYAVATPGGGIGGAPDPGGVRLAGPTDDAPEPGEDDLLADRAREREVRVADAARSGAGAAGSGLGERGSMALKEAAAPATPAARSAPTAPEDSAAAVAPDATEVAETGAGTIPRITVPPPSPTGTVIFSDAFTRAPAGAAAGSDVRAVQDQLLNADLTRQLKQSPGGLKDNAMFVVVSTNDAAETKDRVTSYLVENNIAPAASITWQPVTEPMPGPLDIAESQTAMMSRQNRMQVQMKGGPATGPVDAIGQQQEGQLQQPQQQQSVAAESIESKQQSPRTDETAMATAAARPQQDPAAAADGTPRAAAEPTLPTLSGAPARAEPGNAVHQSAPAPVADGSDSKEMEQQRQLQQGYPVDAQQQLQQAQVPYVRGYFDGRQLTVARGMTRQQAVELQSRLTKQGSVQRAAVYDQAPGVVEPYAVAPGEALNEEAGERMKRESHVEPPVSTSLPVNPPPEPFTLTPTTSATQPAGPEKKLVVDGGATTRPAEQRLADQMGTDAPAAAPGVGPFVIAGAADLDERVDVVIVVHDEAELSLPNEIAPSAPAPPPPPAATVEGQAPAGPGDPVQQEAAMPDRDPAAPAPTATQPTGVDAEPPERP